MIGYGANTSPILLKNHSFQTHNIVLNPALSFGLLGMAVMVIWLYLNLYWAINAENRFVIGVGFFILVSGVTEDTLLSTFPEPATLAWLMISFLPYLAFAESKADARSTSESERANRDPMAIQPAATASVPAS